MANGEELFVDACESLGIHRIFNVLKFNCILVFINLCSSLGTFNEIIPMIKKEIHAFQFDNF